ncbi:MAG: L-2-amino-thiazoline-4-carboxylic acid hydrolase [Kiritimatiellae bacterium]|nr:L-2-amino-thiazoline-4-carboxylic acid hydrolase [Kiritimatiellia bacterium]
MTGELNDILPEPISEANEKVLLEAMKRKAKTAAGLTVRLLRRMEERFGPAAREVVREMVREREPRPRPDAGEPRADLRAFCERMERGCCGSHRWERVVDEPDRIGYHFTRCMWAEIYRELGEPELGFYLCAGDEPAVRSYNPRLGFQRTKVLMNGDEVCDHVFHVEENP